MAKKQEVAQSALEVFVKEKNLTEIFPGYKVFEGFLSQAQVWHEKASKIKVTGLEQIELMTQAREGRLILRDVRIKIEHKRKELKEDSLRTGQAIDLVAKFLTAQVEADENHLHEQEKFIEREQEKLREKIKTEREEKLKPYGVETSFFDLKGMPEDNFNQLLESSRLAMESRIENDKKIEEERVKLEKINARIGQLKEIGFKNNGLGIYEHEYNLQMSEGVLNNVSTSVWDRFIEESTETINSVKAERQKELEDLRLIKDAAEKKENTLKARNEELRPYIIFIRDYNKMLGLSDEDYKKELDDIKEGARQHYEFEAKKEQQKEARINLGKSRQKLLADIGVPVDFDLAADMELKNWADFFNNHLDTYNKKTKEEQAAADRLAKQEADRVKAEQDKQAAIEAELSKGDKEKFIDLVKELDKFSFWTFKSKKHKKLHEDVKTLLGKVINHINEKA